MPCSFMCRVETPGVFEGVQVRLESNCPEQTETETVNLFCLNDVLAVADMRNDEDGTRVCAFPSRVYPA